MIDKTALRQALLHWIRRLPKGKKFTYGTLYKILEDKFPDACCAEVTLRENPATNTTPGQQFGMRCTKDWSGTRESEARGSAFEGLRRTESEN